MEWVEDFIIQRDGEDGIPDTEDDLPFSSVDEVLSQIQSPPDRRSVISPRLTTRGTTVRIESLGVSGDTRRKLLVVIRNRNKFGVRRGDWKLVVSGSGEKQQNALYQIADDPAEQHDVSGQNPEELQKMLGYLARAAAADRDAVVQ